MAEPTMETLARRLDRVERENRRLKRAGVAALAGITLAGCAPMVQPADKWGSRYATPGVHLTLLEVKRTVLDSETEVTYKVQASGFPKGKTYTLWQTFTEGATKPLLSGFYVDDSGQLISEQKLPLEQVPLRLRNFVDGERLEYGLISTDQTVRAFAKAVPFPIEARDGRCLLWLELISPEGNTFYVSGEGFQPGEWVTGVSRSEGEIRERKVKVSSDGTLPSWYLQPAVVGKVTGVASLTVTAKACNLAVQYRWQYKWGQ